MGFLMELVCTRCDAAFVKNQLWNLSTCCQAPLFAKYDLEGAARALRPEMLINRIPTMWRYAEVMPVE